MKTIIVGSGKLMQSLRKGLNKDYKTLSWNEFDRNIIQRSIIIHVGSGRELNDCIEYCKKTESILIELSTGSKIQDYEITFPVIICPNTAIPIVKLMNMLKHYGKDFMKYKITIKESHQKEKTTVAGTAIEIAKYLHSPIDEIRSIRNENIQKDELLIPEKYLYLHAFHEILIEDNGCQIKIETRVLGHDAYITGMKEILKICCERAFENRIYYIGELLVRALEGRWISS
jgi:4-hydroxy-tetrahydrodipicolinate reductase